MKAPALYWHFKDKQALLDEMATEMMRRMAEDFPATPAAGWREVVTGAMRALRGHLLCLPRRRQGVQRHPLHGPVVRGPLEAFLRTLVEAASRRAPSASPRTRWPRRRARRCSPAHDRGFEAGLAAVVAGVGATLVTAGE
ncbi:MULTISPECIES: hypothetical protein [Streptomyces]|uniref:hypothetical protein n=1 Tax=Streptomyces TaxID=1883 RepID=UPI001E63EFB5|nr:MULTISPECIES: hypothetical protein [Streptomyces]UFQ17623.1 hypothetical protein J2N69_22920 [Streptomyces huasconensis]WCL87229.1 hypothetical protein PPN52_22920 [Streptomyces sp. JCM 35825]